jgi:hypothetical protein
MKPHSTQYVVFGPSIQFCFGPDPPYPLPFPPFSSSPPFLVLAAIPYFSGGAKHPYRALSRSMLFLSSCTCFQPCMVLHKTTQYGSTCCFIQQVKNNVDILHIGGFARIILSCSSAIEQIRNLNLPSIDSGAEESTIYFVFK